MSVPKVFSNGISPVTGGINLYIHDNEVGKKSASQTSRDIMICWQIYLVGYNKYVKTDITDGTDYLNSGRQRDTSNRYLIFLFYC